MENDYISRWRAQDAMTAENLIRNLDQVENGDAHRFARAAIRVLEQLEPADVRPVKEGHWVKARGSWFTPGGDPVWECSECGKGVHVYGIEHGTYGSDIADGQWVSCPNCGADMTGGEANARKSRISVDDKRPSGADKGRC